MVTDRVVYEGIPATAGHTHLLSITRQTLQDLATFNNDALRSGDWSVNSITSLRRRTALAADTTGEVTRIMKAAVYVSMVSGAFLPSDTALVGTISAPLTRQHQDVFGEVRKDLPLDAAVGTFSYEQARRQVGKSGLEISITSDECER